MTQATLQILAADQADFQSHSIHESSDGPLLLNNSVGPMTVVGIDVAGQGEGMTRRLLNRGGFPITLAANSAEASASQRFNAGAVIPPDGSLEIVCEGVGWSPLVAGGSSGTLTADLAAEDTIQISKAATARVAVGTYDSSIGDGSASITVGGLTRTWDQADLLGGGAAEIAEFLETNKAEIPAASVADNEDGSFTIAFLPGPNDLEVSTTDENLTFQETATGLPARTETTTLADLATFFAS